MPKIFHMPWRYRAKPRFAGWPRQEKPPFVSSNMAWTQSLRLATRASSEWPVTIGWSRAVVLKTGKAIWQKLQLEDEGMFSHSLLSQALYQVGIPSSSFLSSLVTLTHSWLVKSVEFRIMFNPCIFPMFRNFCWLNCWNHCNYKIIVFPTNGPMNGVLKKKKTALQMRIHGQSPAPPLASPLDLAYLSWAMDLAMLSTLW